MRALPPGALVVNVARGGVIERAALVPLLVWNYFSIILVICSYRFSIVLVLF